MTVLLFINQGRTNGTLLGGNLSTITLLSGTPYISDLREDLILFIEDDEESNIDIFDRMLFNLTESIGRKSIKGILIGRFEKNSDVSKENLVELFHHRKYFNQIPVIADLDFGHTTPIISLPYGGKAQIDAGETFQLQFSTGTT